MSHARSLWFVALGMWILAACDPKPMSVPPADPVPAAQPAPSAQPAPQPSPTARPATPAEQSGGEVLQERVVDDDPADDAQTSGVQDDNELLAAGESCDEAEECYSGICEGQGCGPGQGVCADDRRACTRDRRPYCGCDGQTFYSSGSCPGRRFASRGECKP